jgi:hypothetical protein
MNRRWRSPVVLLAACLLAALLLVAYPMYVIWPFRHQAPTPLAIALEVTRIRPVVAVVVAMAAALLTWMAWKRVSKPMARVGVGLLAAFTLVCCALSFVNVYEIMFHPLRRPIFKDVSETRLDGAEQVIAIKLGGYARAYPIRVISYHHIVNDVLAGVPIVATY